MTEEKKDERLTIQKSRRPYVQPVLVAYGGLTAPLLMASLTGGYFDGKVLMGGVPLMFSK